MPTQCEGQWSAFPREIPTESPDSIYVSTCSGCDEILVIFRHRYIPTGLTKHASDAEITAALLDYCEAMR